MDVAFLQEGPVTASSLRGKELTTLPLGELAQVRPDFPGVSVAIRLASSEHLGDEGAERRVEHLGLATRLARRDLFHELLVRRPHVDRGRASEHPVKEE